MSQYVTDTHALLWFLSKDAQLSPTARTIFQQADAGVNTIIVPSIVLVECVYLAEKKKIAETRINDVLEKLARQPYPYQLAHIDPDTIRALRTVERASVPDMPDRIIVATALQLGLPLITRDKDMSSVPTVTVVWR